MKKWRRLSFFTISRLQSNNLAMSLEASFSETAKPRKLDCFLTPEQAIELGTALQESGAKCLRLRQQDLKDLT